VLADWLTPDTPLHRPVFSPADAQAEVRQRRHEQRTTPMSQGNTPGSNVADEPKRAPRSGYDVASYRRAIYRACDKASVPRWSPNRLRHLFATEVRRDHGLEAAQVLLGHTKADVTQVYAERDMAKAKSVAAKVG
jgi:integrase